MKNLLSLLMVLSLLFVGSSNVATAVEAPDSNTTVTLIDAESTSSWEDRSSWRAFYNENDWSWESYRQEDSGGFIDADVECLISICLSNSNPFLLSDNLEQYNRKFDSFSFIDQEALIWANFDLIRHGNGKDKSVNFINSLLEENKADSIMLFVGISEMTPRWEYNDSDWDLYFCQNATVIGDYRYCCGLDQLSYRIPFHYINTTDQAMKEKYNESFSFFG